MVSTIQTRNGFRSELLPMALACPSPAADALRNAMLAVSAFHYRGSAAALPYKITAVRTLAESLSPRYDCNWVGFTEAQIAASMMLCVYNVGNTANQEEIAKPS